MQDSSIFRRLCRVEFFLFAAALPLVIVHLHHLWRYRPHYQFFPILLVGIALLTWSRWPGWLEPTRFSKLLGYLLLGSGIALLVAGTLMMSPTLAAAAAILLWGALLIKMIGENHWQLLPLWLLAWLIVPPLRLDLKLIQALQGLTSTASSRVLDVIGIPHLMSGNVLDLPGQRLLVEEACSGINSLFVLLCASGLFVIAVRRPLVRSVLLIVSAVMWALLTNIARVVLIGKAHDSWQADWAHGLAHDVLGVVLIAIAFGLLISTDCVLGWLLGPISSSQWHGDVLRKIYLRENPLVVMWRRCLGGEQEAGGKPASSQLSTATAPAAGRWSTFMAAALACLLVALQTLVVFPSAALGRNLGLQTALYHGTDLPQLASCRVVDYQTEQRGLSSDQGARSNVWTVTSPQCEMRLSVDYPFVGWHDLTTCYTAQGWDIAARKLETRSKDEGGDFIEVMMSKPTGEHGYLLFSLFDADGTPLTPDPTHWRALLARLAENPIVRGLTHRIPRGVPTGVSFQIQQFVPTLSPLADVQRHLLHERFLTYREGIRNKRKQAGDS